MNGVSRLHDALACLVLFTATLIAYSPALSNGFVNYDDPIYVSQNSNVLTGISFSNTRWAFTTTQGANWHPLTWLSLQMDSQLYAAGPRGYITTNLLLHGASALLLFLVLRAMTGRPARSFFVAAFFALHPLHVESVAWISERKDVLCGFFWMLTLLAYVFYVQRPTLGRYLLVFVLLALALVAKPMAVTLPFVLVLLDYWPLSRFPALREKLPLFTLALIAGGLTLYAQRATGAVANTFQAPLAIRLANALISYCAYLGKTVWPVNLAVYYPYPRNGFPFLEVVAAGFFLLVITAGVVRWRRRLPYLLVGWLWFLGTLLPVIGLIQVGAQAMADRYTYLPLIGVFIALVWTVSDLAGAWNLEKPAAALTSFLLCTLALYTWVQVGYWRDSMSLWDHTLRVTSENSRAHVNLGMALIEEKHSFGAAIPQFLLALKVDPEDRLANANLGGALVQERRPAEAIPYLQFLLQIAPDDTQGHTNLASAYEMMGNRDEALKHYRRAEDLGCPDMLLQLKLGSIMEQRGELDEAIEHYRNALTKSPNDPVASQWLERALEKKKDLKTP